MTGEIFIGIVAVGIAYWFYKKMPKYRAVKHLASHHYHNASAQYLVDFFWPELEAYTRCYGTNDRGVTDLLRALQFAAQGASGDEAKARTNLCVGAHLPENQRMVQDAKGFLRMSMAASGVKI